MEEPTPTIASEVDNSYTLSVDAQTAASMYLINPRGPLRDVYLNLHACFLKLYLYTSSLPDVSVRVDDTKQGHIEAWFENKLCTPETLRTGIRLHRDYISILLDTGTILIRRT